MSHECKKSSNFKFQFIRPSFWLSIKHNSKRKNKLNNKPNDNKVMLVETLEKFPNHIP